MNLLPFVDFLFCNEQVDCRIRFLYFYKSILGSSIFCTTSDENKCMSSNIYSVIEKQILI